MVNRLYYGGSAAIELEGEKIDVVVDSMIMEREREDVMRGRVCAVVFVVLYG